MIGPADQLHQNLDAIRQSILTGDFAALAILTQSLEAALGRPKAALDRKTLIALQAKADRNAALLRAAQRGLRAAQRRISEIRGVSLGLSTYDASGQRAYQAHSVNPDHRA